MISFIETLNVNGTQVKELDVAGLNLDEKEVARLQQALEANYSLESAFTEHNFLHIVNRNKYLKKQKRYKLVKAPALPEIQ